MTVFSLSQSPVMSAPLLTSTAISKLSAPSDLLIACLRPSHRSAAHDSPSRSCQSCPSYRHQFELAYSLPSLVDSIIAFRPLPWFHVPITFFFSRGGEWGQVKWWISDHRLFCLISSCRLFGDCHVFLKIMKKQTEHEGETLYANRLIRKDRYKQ